jgi:protein TonB
MMRYFRTIHQRKSVIATVFVMSILLFLMYAFGMKYQDPPEEYGVAIRFGTTDIARELPIADKNTLSNSKTSEEPTNDELITQENKEAPVIRKERSESLTAPMPSKEAQNALENLMKGNPSKQDRSEINGAKDKSSMKGKEEGISKMSKYYDSTGGDGDENYNLSGRKALARPIVKPNCNEEGTVVVRIEVNKTGNVVKALPGVKGTTNTAPCLLTPAKEAALKTKWNADGEAPTTQIGVIVYKFSLSK